MTFKNHQYLYCHFLKCLSFRHAYCVAWYIIEFFHHPSSWNTPAEPSHITCTLTTPIHPNYLPCGGSPRTSLLFCHARRCTLLAFATLPASSPAPSRAETMSLPWNTSSAAPSAQQKVPARAVPGTIRQVRGATYPPLTAPPGGQHKEKVPSPQCAARSLFAAAAPPDGASGKPFQESLTCFAATHVLRFRAH